MTVVLAFFHMSGYGAYVWAAYAAAVLGMIGGLLWLRRQKRRLLAQRR